MLTGLGRPAGGAASGVPRGAERTAAGVSTVGLLAATGPAGRPKQNATSNTEH